MPVNAMMASSVDRVVNLVAAFAKGIAVRAKAIPKPVRELDSVALELGRLFISEYPRKIDDREDSDPYEIKEMPEHAEPVDPRHDASRQSLGGNLEQHGDDLDEGPNATTATRARRIGP